MKQFILCLVIVFNCFAANAQESSLKTHSIRVQYDGSYPTGDFKNTAFEEDYPPFAKAGSLLQFNYSRSIKEQVLTGATLAWRRNAFDMDAFANPEDELVQSRESKSWQSVFMMADMQYRWFARDGFFYVKGSLGTAYSRSASLRVNTTYGTINRASDNSFAFAYGLHGGLQVDIKQFGLGFETGVFSTNPTFSITNAQGKTTTYKQTMATYNMGIYTSYNF